MSQAASDAKSNVTPINIGGGAGTDTIAAIALVVLVVWLILRRN